jgi:recombination protein U
LIQIQNYKQPNPKNQIRGAQSKRNGEYFESLILASCEHYRLSGMAHIEKTPEEMKPLSGMDKNGYFKACFVKQAQPDFKGTLCGGRAIVFEAKHTDSDRIKQNVLTDEQVKSLELHFKLNAATYVLVSMGFSSFYFVPYAVWRDMKSIFGHKYMNEKELTAHKVKYKIGIICFLN